MKGPAKPAIVYLHGMAGGHLERRGNGDGRIWFNVSHLLRGDLGDRLRAASADSVSPAGHIRLFHRPAAFYWRRRGHAVHEFAYDWRLSLDDGAARLRDFVAPLVAEGVEFVFVGHSMGGCVALRYASMWGKGNERGVLIGVPVRGTFAVVEVLLGQFLLPRLVAAAAGPRRRGEALGSLRRAAAEMAGLVDLLPDPAVFPSASLLYHRENWPEECAPAQELLTRSLALKKELAESPLLNNSLCLAARRWPTPCEVDLSGPGGRIALRGETTPGDNVVPFVSAIGGESAGRRAEVISFPHAFQLWEPAVLRAPIL